MKKYQFGCHIVVIVFLLLNFMFAACKAAKAETEAKIILPVHKKDTVILLKDLRIQILEGEKAEDKAGVWKKQMPWIASIIVGLLAFGANSLVSYNSRRTSLETAEKQLDNATKLALAQIDQSRANNERDFNKTVMSGNRQNWITEFRDIMSDILSLLSSFIIKGTVTDKEHAEFKLLVIKAELMLTNDVDGSTVKVLHEAQTSCLNIAQGNADIDELPEMIVKIKIASITKLKETWEKVKKGQ